MNKSHMGSHWSYSCWVLNCGRCVRIVNFSVAYATLRLVIYLSKLLGLCLCILCFIVSNDRPSGGRYIPIPPGPICQNSYTSSAIIPRWGNTLNDILPPPLLSRDSHISVLISSCSISLHCVPCVLIGGDGQFGKVIEKGQTSAWVMSCWGYHYNFAWV